MRANTKIYMAPNASAKGVWWWGMRVAMETTVVYRPSKDHGQKDLSNMAVVVRAMHQRKKAATTTTDGDASVICAKAGSVCAKYK